MSISPPWSPAASRLLFRNGTHGGPPMAAIVLRYVWPFTVTFTGTRNLPNTVRGSNVSGMKHIDPSRTIVVLNVFVNYSITKLLDYQMYRQGALHVKFTASS